MKPTKRKLEKHLLTMRIALLHCYTINHSSYGKKQYYFRKQMEITKQKLKSYGK